ncbi:hypothetical protein BLNAU_10622 [Blattamonas nauphoetae]|uniref:Uncharacterized protein n=1 Tax=Blattamonas nauphoetae TaxID=2049346 RepID=A0ABQ9XRG2_9EUKA|nr:hypothetical protein BLNAU_10622 [Blattamonas nauphoetae]
MEGYRAKLRRFFSGIPLESIQSSFLANADHSENLSINQFLRMFSQIDAHHILNRDETITLFILLDPLESKSVSWSTFSSAVIQFLEPSGVVQHSNYDIFLPVLDNADEDEIEHAIHKKITAFSVGQQSGRIFTGDVSGVFKVWDPAANGRIEAVVDYNTMIAEEKLARQRHETFLQTHQEIEHEVFGKTYTVQGRVEIGVSQDGSGTIERMIVKPAEENTREAKMRKLQMRPKTALAPKKPVHEEDDKDQGLIPIALELKRRRAWTARYVDDSARGSRQKYFVGHGLKPPAMKWKGAQDNTGPSFKKENVEPASTWKEKWVTERFEGGQTARTMATNVSTDDLSWFPLFLPEEFVAPKSASVPSVPRTARTFRPSTAASFTRASSMRATDRSPSFTLTKRQPSSSTLMGRPATARSNVMKEAVQTRSEVEKQARKEQKALEKTQNALIACEGTFVRRMKQNGLFNQTIIQNRGRHAAENAMQRISIAAIVEMETSGWIVVAGSDHRLTFYNPNTFTETGWIIGLDFAVSCGTSIPTQNSPAKRELLVFGTGEGFIVVFAINNNVLHSQLDLSTSTGVANYKTALGIRDDVEEDEFGLFEKGEPMRVDLHGLTTTISQVRYPSEWKETKREGVSTLTARDDQTKRTIEWHEEEPDWDDDGWSNSDTASFVRSVANLEQMTKEREDDFAAFLEQAQGAEVDDAEQFDEQTEMLFSRTALPPSSPLSTPRPSLVPPSKPHTSFPLNLPTEEPAALHPKRHSSPQLSARNGFSPRRNSAIQSLSRSIHHADDVATIRSPQSPSQTKRVLSSKLFNLPASMSTWRKKVHSDRVTSISFLPHLSALLTSSLDALMILSNPASLDPVVVFRGHSKGVNDCEEEEEHGVIVSGGNDGVVLGWNELTGQIVSTLRGHTSAVLSVAVTKIGKREVGEQRQKKTKSTRKATAATAAEEESTTANSGLLMAVSVSSDGMLCVWDFQKEVLLKRMSAFDHISGFNITVLSGKGKRKVKRTGKANSGEWWLEENAQDESNKPCLFLCSRNVSGWIHASQRKLIQDVSTVPKKEQSKTQVVSISPPTLIRYVFLSASQTALVTLDEKNIVRTFEVASGSLFASFEALCAGTITAACLCAPFDMLVVATSGGMVLAWNVFTATLMLSLDRRKERVAVDSTNDIMPPSSHSQLLTHHSTNDIPAIHRMIPIHAHTTPGCVVCVGPRSFVSILNARSAALAYTSQAPQSAQKEGWLWREMHREWHSKHNGDMTASSFDGTGRLATGDEKGGVVVWSLDSWGTWKKVVAEEQENGDKADQSDAKPTVGSPVVSTTQPIVSLAFSPLNEDSLLVLSDVHSSVSRASHSILRVFSIVFCTECARIDLERLFTAILPISQPNSSLLASATDYNRMKERSIVAGVGTPHPTPLPQLSTSTLSIMSSSEVLVLDMAVIESRAEESRRKEEENRDFQREMEREVESSPHQHGRRGDGSAFVSPLSTPQAYSPFVSSRKDREGTRVFFLPTTSLNETPKNPSSPLQAHSPLFAHSPMIRSPSQLPKLKTGPTSSQSPSPLSSSTSTLRSERKYVEIELRDIGLSRYECKGRAECGTMLSFALTHRPELQVSLSSSSLSVASVSSQEPLDEADPPNNLFLESLATERTLLSQATKEGVAIYVLLCIDDVVHVYDLRGGLLSLFVQEKSEDEKKREAQDSQKKGSRANQRLVDVASSSAVAYLHPPAPLPISFAVVPKAVSFAVVPKAVSRVSFEFNERPLSRTGSARKMNRNPSGVELRRQDSSMLERQESEEEHKLGWNSLRHLANFVGIHRSGEGEDEKRAKPSQKQKIVAADRVIERTRGRRPNMGTSEITPRTRSAIAMRTASGKKQVGPVMEQLRRAGFKQINLLNQYESVG